MSPTVRHDTVRADPSALDHVALSRTPRAVRVYALTLLALALGVTVALLVVGAALPPPGVLLLLAVPLALCMNRFVFFPNEVGVTADAAVIFAAVVGLRADALWLGPLLVALLVGPLDARHWEHRAYLRMAYNSGSTALVTLAGVAVFVPVADALGGSGPALVGAVAVAVVPYVLVESVLGVVLVVLHGEPTGAAVRHQLPVNTVAVPLALVGAAVGLAAADLGWWAALLLLPVPAVPELLLVEIPRRWRTRPRAVWAGVGLSALAVAVLAVTLPLPRPVPLALLVAFAALLGLESRVDERDPVPTLGALGAVVAVVVVPGTAGFLAAAVAALVTTATAWTVGRARMPWYTCPLATAGALAAVGLDALLAPGTRPAHAAVALLAAVTAGLACLGLTQRRRAIVGWCAPIVAVTAAAAALGEMFGGPGIAVFSALMVVTLVGSAAWGAPVWRSRVLGRASSGSSASARTGLLVTGLALGASGAVGVVCTAGDARGAGMLLAVAATQIDVTLVMHGVRQWRFAPRRRTRDLTVLGSVGLVSIAVYPVVARAHGVASLALAVPLLALPVLVARGTRRRGEVQSKMSASRPERASPD